MTEHTRPPLEPDVDEIEAFVQAMFRYATPSTDTPHIVSLRSFVDGTNKVFRLTPVRLGDGPFLRKVIGEAVKEARLCARHDEPVVFCPPLAAFRSQGASEPDVVEGYTLSVECDAHPREARERLEDLLGAATVVVASGGIFLNGGEPEDKLHLHWRLRTPARGEDLAKLKWARRLAAQIVGADLASVPVCHPIRWPGSWHRKATPRLCRIVSQAPDFEIDLDGALVILEAVAPPEREASSESAGAGVESSALIADILAGQNYHVSITTLAAKMVAAGMSDGATVNHLRALMENSSAPQDLRWHTRVADIPRAVSTARAKYRNQNDEPPPQPGTPMPAIKWVDMSAWDSEPVPEREWAIRDRVPLRQAGLFSGEGGTGKSITELQKNVAHVLGRDWLGSMPEPGPAFYIGAEDDEKELHIRLAAIARHYATTFRELTDRGLYIKSLLGQDATLCAANGKSGRVETTPLYRQIYQAAGDIKPKNISIDTLSLAFVGSEIDRVQVYGFANHMQALAMVAGGSVTVLSHPSLAGIASGSGISGSTAWHGAFRFRQYLSGIKPGEEQPDNDLRKLEFKKNQYGPLSEPIVLRYQHGLFLPEGGISNLDKLAREARLDDIFLSGLKEVIRQGRDAIYGKTSADYAPTLIAELAAAKKGGARKGDLEAAMSRLLASGKIHVGETAGPPAKRKKCLLPGARTQNPQQQENDHAA